MDVIVKRDVIVVPSTKIPAASFSWSLVMRYKLSIMGCMSAGILLFTEGAFLPALASTIETNFGAITLVPGYATSTLLLNGKPIVTIDGPASMVRSYAFGGHEYVLIENSGNGEACPLQYNIVDFNKSGHESTKQFGSCARVSSITADGPIWKICMPGL